MKPRLEPAPIAASLAHGSKAGKDGMRTCTLPSPNKSRLFVTTPGATAYHELPCALFVPAIVSTNSLAILFSPLFNRETYKLSQMLLLRYAAPEPEVVQKRSWAREWSRTRPLFLLENLCASRCRPMCAWQKLCDTGR